MAFQWTKICIQSSAKSPPNTEAKRTSEPRTKQINSLSMVLQSPCWFQTPTSASMSVLPAASVRDSVYLCLLPVSVWCPVWLPWTPSARAAWASWPSPTTCGPPLLPWWWALSWCTWSTLVEPLRRRRLRRARSQWPAPPMLCWISFGKRLSCVTYYTLAPDRKVSNEIEGFPWF